QTRHPDSPVQVRADLRRDHTVNELGSVVVDRRRVRTRIAVRLSRIPPRLLPLARRDPHRFDDVRDRLDRRGRQIQGELRKVIETGHWVSLNGNRRAVPCEYADANTIVNVRPTRPRSSAAV